MARDLLLEPTPRFAGRSAPRDLLAPRPDWTSGWGEEGGAVSALAGITPRQLAERGHGTAAGLLQTGEDIYREGISPILSGGSTFAGGIPKQVAAAQGQRELVFPEQRTLPGQALRVGAETAGYVAGVPARLAKFAGRMVGEGVKRVPQFFGKALAGRVAQGAAAGGTGFAAATGGGLEERGEAAKVGASVGGAIPIIGAAGKGLGGLLTKSGRWVARSIGGVSDATVDIIKRLGADRVFEPIKSKFDYLGSVVVPKAQARINQAVDTLSSEGQEVLTSLGVKPEQLEVLRKVSPATRRKLRGMLGEGPEEINERIVNVRRQAGERFNQALPDDAQINVREPLIKLRDTLQREGWVDKNGQLVRGANIPNKTKTYLARILRHYERQALPTKGGQVPAQTVLLDANGYRNLLNELEASISGQDKFDRMIFSAQRTVRQAAADQIPKLRTANREWADAMRLEELQKVFARLDNVVNLESKLLSLKDVRRAQLHGQWKNILGRSLYDDVLAHLANQDFELVSSLPGAGGGFAPYRTRIMQKMVSPTAKAYYQHVAPRVKTAKEAIGRISAPVRELGERAGLLR